MVGFPQFFCQFFPKTIPVLTSLRNPPEVTTLIINITIYYIIVIYYITIVYCIIIIVFVIINIVVTVIVSVILVVIINLFQFRILHLALGNLIFCKQ